MRVLHLLNDVRESGNGIVNVAVDLACAQARAEHEIAVAAGRGEQEAMLAAHGVVFHELRLRPRPTTLLRAAARLRGILRDFQPEVVHCHTVSAFAAARMARWFARFTLVSHIHNIRQRSSAWMRGADRVIVVSSAVMEEMARRGVPRERMRVVHNRVGGGARLGTKVGTVALEQPAVVTVAGMYRHKGIGDLIAAFRIVRKRIPAAHLYLVGDGPDRLAFENAPEVRSAPSNIHFVGFQRDPRPWMRASRVFALASRRESFGLVLEEARQQGCAIVATDTDGVSEALDGGRAGLLVRPVDPRALAEALVRIIENEAERQRLRRASRDGWSEDGVANMAAQVLGIYEGLTCGARNESAAEQTKSAPLIRATSSAPACGPRPPRPADAPAHERGPA